MCESADKKKNALGEAFSMHIETSWRCVDGSTGAGGEQELDGGWPMFITRGYRGSANIKRLQTKLNIDRMETKLNFVEICTFHQKIISM